MCAWFWRPVKQTEKIDDLIFVIKLYPVQKNRMQYVCKLWTWYKFRHSYMITQRTWWYHMNVMEVLKVWPTKHGDNTSFSVWATKIKWPVWWSNTIFRYHWVCLRLYKRSLNQRDALYKIHSLLSINHHHHSCFELLSGSEEVHILLKTV